MSSLGIESPASYLDYLQVHQDEFTHLFNSILINVTSFFRDPEAWDFVRAELVPKVISSSERTEGHIRIWSAGCASGEGCYSVAILFAATMGSHAFRNRVKIYATDGTKRRSRRGGSRLTPRNNDDQKFDGSGRCDEQAWRRIRVRVQCVSIGAPEQGRGIIVLMQEIRPEEPGPTRH